MEVFKLQCSIIVFILHVNIFYVLIIVDTRDRLTPTWVFEHRLREEKKWAPVPPISAFVASL